ncbi:PAO [Symbiodinium natans]|uniref:PAO protein n=1 Tax=Symbiodinium natans TaxID=878477 RepID=A0A812PI59_9DINO|nr:PAO [Symbiodinium natans]
MVDCTGRYSLTHIRTSLPRSGRGGGADLHDRPPLAGALVFPTLSQGLGTRGDQQNTEVWSVVVGLGPAGSKLKTWVAIKTGDKRATRRGRIHRSGLGSGFRGPSVPLEAFLSDLTPVRPLGVRLAPRTPRQAEDATKVRAYEVNEARWVKPVYALASVAALWSARRSWLDASARCATVMVALLDFAPTAASQLAGSAAAWRASSTSRRWAVLVRLKVLGELCGLLLVCNGRWPACFGASVAILSHVLFWLCGAASARVDASGKPAPVPPPVARAILGADVAVLAAAVAGYTAPGAWGCAGTATYTGAVTLVACEKLAKFNSKSQKSARSGKTARKAASDGETAARGWDEFSWRSNWYPVAFADVTDKERPHRIELFGDGLVLWWDTNAAAWCVTVDRCPHRMAPLSEGRVDEIGHVECPYHGWTFDGKTGACHKIPQAAESNQDLLGRCSVTVMRTVERQGLVWVWGQPGASIEEADESLIPLCDALEDSEFECIDVSRDMPYSADILLENLLDSSHVPFTHHKTVSKRENAQPLPLQITKRVSASGFQGAFKQDTPVGKQGADAKKNGRTTERSTIFSAPTYMHHRIRTADAKGSLDNGFETWTVAYATPTGPGRSRLFARFPFRFPAPKFGPNLPRFLIRHLPDWLNHLGQLRVLDDDNIFLPIQERQVQDAGGWKNYIMPTSADTFVTAFRTWFDRAGPPPHAPSAVDEYRSRQPTRAELLDREAQHTAHCKSCTVAVRRSRKIVCLCRGLLLLAAGAAPTLFARHCWRGLALLLLASCVVGKVWQVAWAIAARLTSGLHDYPPPRNRQGRRGQSRELRTVEQGRRF